jgi:hypothetical protein
MTMTEERSRQHRRDLIAFATRGQLGLIGKSGLIIVLIVGALLLALKSLDKPRSSAADRLDARGATAGALQPSSCSIEFALSFISRPIGCENSLAQARRP